MPVCEINEDEFDAIKKNADDLFISNHQGSNGSPVFVQVAYVIYCGLAYME